MDMLAADVFKSDLFSSTSLTDAINEIPYIPQRLAELGIFGVTGIATTSALIERKGNTLELVQTTPRGGVGTSVAIDKRQAINFQSSHLELTDKIYADEVQNVRAFGSPDALAGVTQVRDERILKMSNSIDLTLEYHRLGAIQGLILDADGTTVLEDLYDKFGITAADSVSLHLTDAWTTDAGGPVRAIIAGVTRSIDVDLGGVNPSGYWAACSDDFFDKIVSHPEIRSTYLNQAEAADLRGDARQRFQYGNMMFENYKGIGAVKIPDGSARVVPTGVPQLFRQLFCPADTMEAVNTVGIPKYSYAVPDPSGKDKFLELAVQSNPITYCSRPKVLRELTIS